MKIAFGLVAVLVMLLGMIAAIGNLDGSITFGEPSADTPSMNGSTTAGPSTGDSSLMTGEEQAYLEFVVGTLETVSNDIQTLGMVFSQPEMDDEGWQSTATLLLNRIELAYGAIATLEPSPRLQPFQDASVRALDNSAEFVNILRGRLIEGETELTDEAAAKLVAAAEAFGEAEELLVAFLTTYTAPA